MRAQRPQQSGYVEREHVRIYYETFGGGEQTLLLLPAWSIVHSRLWKAQIPYLARRYRVVTFDGRGNGKSGRPEGANAYISSEFVADAIAVMSATKTERAIVIGFSFGGHLAAIFAARHPERVNGAVLFAPSAPFGPANTHISRRAFSTLNDSPEGWAKFNQHYWRRDYRGFAEFFFAEAFIEPHSTKQIEDGVGWALETTPETLIDTMLARFLPHEEGEEIYRSIRCPVLIVHGDLDNIVPYAKGKLIADLTGGELVTMEGSGHVPLARDPVPVNLLIRDFVEKATRQTKHPVTIRRGLGRKKRALYLSSPIGLGHARRDLAIARHLRDLQPELAIDWLAQHPVTALLETASERIHPASRVLLNESEHIESEAGEHTLHVFEALRRMDEILVANFMIFQEVVEAGDYDLVIADEAWDVDHFWHEYPALKRGALAWLTDFVGFLPMPEGGEREARLTADYNTEMIEHVARFPRVRDLAIFIGNPEDIVAGAFGPGLPGIREWTQRHFEFSGYITGFDPAALGRRAELRDRFGYAPEEKVCIVAVGGSGVGMHLLRRAIDAYPTARRRVAELRMVVVAGPRIDPDSLPRHQGIDIHGYVPDLYQRLAACDLALVQGGLSTCMELTAVKTPFIYFPLRNHFEQTFHVSHRLKAYGAGRRMDYASAGPEEIAAAMVQEIGRPVAYRDVECDGAIRVAQMLGSLL
jgi:pimeloyl-ACP methyl ester carboxylesterase/predicted glycosyltransferase